MFYRITAPNAEYAGLSCGVNFVNGEAETKDQWAAGMLSEAGYIVEEIAEDADQQKENIEDPAADPAVGDPPADPQTAAGEDPAATAAKGKKK